MTLKRGSNKQIRLELDLVEPVETAQAFVWHCRGDLPWLLRWVGPF